MQMHHDFIRELEIPLWARNRALHYLAGNYNYKLSDELRHQRRTCNASGIPQSFQVQSRKQNWARGRARSA
jgi:hypothetical protein